ncbi:MAG TPA: hypothetical protein VMF89_11590, partial [Polyangiales bacterium]|nr:hypothetical protein [Polyangiales bacterium]
MPDAAPDPLRQANHAVGHALSRVDGIEKVTGRARYTADILSADLAHASLVCSQIARGTIVDIDLKQAERAPGVIAIMTHRNAPRMRPAPLLLTFKGASFTHLPVLQDASVRWNGEPVALV